MMDFFRELPQHAFLQNALWVGLLAGVACGMVGTYVVVRRITYVAGAIAHTILGGMGAAQYLRVNHGWEFLDPLHGAIVSALLAAMIIGWVTLRAKEREDTVIGAIWAIGMAAGILFISQTRGYNQDLMSYLFGTILLVSHDEVTLILLLDLLVLAIVWIGYNRFLAVCFDEEFARLRGVNVEAVYLLLLCLVAITVVLLIKVVGVVLVIALLTLPVATAGYFTRRLWHMMALSMLLSMLFTTGGLMISYEPDLPVGATTIILAGAAYLAVTFLLGVMRRSRGAR